MPETQAFASVAGGNPLTHGGAMTKAAKQQQDSPARNTLDDLAVMSAAEAMAVTALSYTSMRRLEAEGTFPKRVVIGHNKVAYRRRQIEAWLASRQHASAMQPEQRPSTQGAKVRLTKAEARKRQQQPQPA
jgi:predicted DNA-binding transcriptional regulator AlpA